MTDTPSAADALLNTVEKIADITKEEFEKMGDEAFFKTVMVARVGLGEYIIKTRAAAPQEVDVSDIYARDFNFEIEQGYIDFPSDMDPDVFLRVMKQDDGDIVLSVFEKDKDTAYAEFCSPSIGGGRNRALWMALVDFFNEAKRGLIGNAQGRG